VTLYRRGCGSNDNNHHISAKRAKKRQKVELEGKKLFGRPDEFFFGQQFLKLRIKQPADNRVGDRDLVNVTPPQFGKEIAIGQPIIC
jgi:hypothetical protein